MKKLLVLVFALGFLGTAQAQFGIRAGFSSANFSDFDSDAIAGFHVGGYYKKDLGFVSVEPGLQFSQKGYQRNSTTGHTTKNDRINYVDIPVLVRVNFLPFLNVFAGPQGSLLVSRNMELVNGDTVTDTEPIRGYDIAGVVGVGANLPFGLNAQLSYDIGFQSVQYYDQDVKNNVFKISVGYDF